MPERMPQVSELDDGCSPLFLASKNGHERVVGNLLEARADVNQAADDGSSSLFQSSKSTLRDSIAM